MDPTGKGSLEIQFSTTSGFRPAEALGWREGCFANWTVILGEQRYKLHKYNLAKASTFFESAMTENYQSIQTDLTNLLPTPCWSCFEDILDVIYQEGEEAPKGRCSTATGFREVDGVLTGRTVVPLLAAADLLGLQDLFERAVVFLQWNMGACFFAFWRSCTAFPDPLSAPLEKVASVSRGSVLKNFERLLETEKEAVLQLPVDALLGILQEDELAVRSEMRLACFMLEYGWFNALLDSESLGRGEMSCLKPDGQWWSICAALRWSNLEAELQYGFESHLPLARTNRRHGDSAGSPIAKDLETLPGEYITRAIRGTPVKRDVSSKSSKVAVLPPGTPIIVLEVIPVPEEECIRGRIADPAGYISMFNTRNSSSSVIPAQSQLKHFAFGRYYYLADYFPDEFVLAAMAHNRAQSTWMCHLRHVVPQSLTFRPRCPVRPSHAPSLLPNQAEQFFYFGPSRWKQGDLLRSPPAVSGPMRFQLNVFPGCDTGWEVPPNGWAVSAYVMVVPEVHWTEGWEMHNVEFTIQCVPWKENAPHLQFKRTVKTNFSAQKLQVGWKGFLSSSMVGDAAALCDLLSPEGYLLVQGGVTPSSSMKGHGLPALNQSFAEHAVARPAAGALASTSGVGLKGSKAAKGEIASSIGADTAVPDSGLANCQRAPQVFPQEFRQEKGTDYKDAQQDQGL